LPINFNETKWESMIQLVIQGAATISKTLGYINPKNTVNVISLNHKKVVTTQALTFLKIFWTATPSPAIIK